MLTSIVKSESKQDEGTEKTKRKIHVPVWAEGINRLIRAHGTEVKQWSHREPLKVFYEWFDRFNRRFFGGKLDCPVISIERTRVTRLGHFVRGRDGLGVRNHININKAYVKKPLGVNLVTLCHEMIHLWEQTVGKPGKNGYHSRAFRSKAAEIGILCDERGRPMAEPMDPLASLLQEFGEKVVSQFVARLPGRSTLRKFMCQCPIIVRVADPRFAATCHHCHKAFKPSP